MKFFTTVFFLVAFLVFIEMPERSLAERSFVNLVDNQPGPHKVYNSCHSCHIDSCTGRYDLVPMDCDYALCWSGYICEPGYIRESPKGRCILPSECPPRG